MITALWDIDGTLVESPKGRSDLFTEAVQALGVKPVGPSGPRDGFTDRRLAEAHLVFGDTAQDALAAAAAQASFVAPTQTPPS